MRSQLKPEPGLLADVVQSVEGNDKEELLELQERLNNKIRVRSFALRAFRLTLRSIRLFLSFEIVRVYFPFVLLLVYFS